MASNFRRRLVGRGRAEQVIFITGGASVPTCVQAMKAGAFDYLPNPFRDEDLLCAVERALERSSKQWLQRLQRKEVRDRLATLTPRESDELKSVIAGMLNKQIAAQFSTTERPIKLHPRPVMKNMRPPPVAAHLLLPHKPPTP